MALVQGGKHVLDFVDSHRRIETRVADLEGHLTDLSKKVEWMQKQIAEMKGIVVPEGCKRRECAYYAHYLPLGPESLTHEGYHAAEAKYLEAQSKWLDWFRMYRGARADAERTNPYSGTVKDLEERIRK